MKLVEKEVNQLVDFLTTQNCQVEATQVFWHLAPSVLYEETGERIFSFLGMVLSVCSTSPLGMSG